MTDGKFKTESYVHLNTNIHIDAFFYFYLKGK